MKEGQWSRVQINTAGLNERYATCEEKSALLTARMARCEAHFDDYAQVEQFLRVHELYRKEATSSTLHDTPKA